MTDVFISYSRRDAGFMQRVFAALKAQQFDAWVDWEDIAKGTNWLQEIYAGIEGANTFLLIVSPDSLASEVCHQEISHALTHHKRIIPILHREVDGTLLAAQWQGKAWEVSATANWDTVRHINWLFFRESDNFDEAFASLLKTLNTDIDHVKTHTRLTVRAVEWERNQRQVEFMLRGSDLDKAEQWLARGSEKQPTSTDLQREYVISSRLQWNKEQEAERVRQRNLMQARIGLLLAIALMALLGFLTFWLRNRDNARSAAALQEQVNLAERNAAESQSLALAANGRLLREDNPALALSLLVEANSIPNPPALSERLLSEHVYGASALANVLHDANSTATLTFASSTTLRLATEGNYEVINFLTGEVVEQGQQEVPPYYELFCDEAVANGCVGSQIVDTAVGEGQTVFTYPGLIYAYTVSPDGLQLAVTLCPLEYVDAPACLAELWLVEIATGEAIWQSDPLAVTFNVMPVFTPTGDAVFAGGCTERNPAGACLGSTLWRWSTATGAVEQTFEENTLVRDVYPVPEDDRVLVTRCGIDFFGNCNANLITVFAGDGTVLHQMADDLSYIDTLAFSHQYLVASAQDEVVVYDLATYAERQRYPTANEGVMDVHISPDERFVLGRAWDDRIFVWEVEVPLPMQVYDVPFEMAFDLTSASALTPEGHLIATGCLEEDDCYTPVRWNLAEQQLETTYPAQAGRLLSTYLSPEGTAALSETTDGQYILWRLADGATLFEVGVPWWSSRFVPGAVDLTRCATPDFDGLNCDQLQLIRLDTATGAILETFDLPTDLIPDISTSFVALYFTPAMDYVWLVSDTSLRVWAVASRTQVYEETFDTDDREVAFSGDYAVTGSYFSRGAQLRRLTGEVIGSFAGSLTSVTSVQFSADGQRVIGITGEGTVLSWEVATRAVAWEMHLPNVSSQAMWFNADGSALVGLTNTGLQVFVVSFDPLPEFVEWVRENRYLAPLTCEVRLTYRIQPLCEETTQTPAATGG